MKKIMSSLLSVFFALSALATEGTDVAQSTAQTSEIQPNYSKKSLFFSLDGVPIVLHGLGGRFGAALTDNFSLAVMGGYSRIDNSEFQNDFFGDISVSHTLTEFGIIGEFYPMGTHNQRGIYISGGLSRFHVESEGNDAAMGAFKSSATDTGALINVGYQFIIHLKDAANIEFHTGLGYSHAASVKWTYNNGDTNTEIESGLRLDLLAGIQF